MICKIMNVLTEETLLALSWTQWIPFVCAKPFERSPPLSNDPKTGRSERTCSVCQSPNDCRSWSLLLKRVEDVDGRFLSSTLCISSSRFDCCSALFVRPAAFLICEGPEARLVSAGCARCIEVAIHDGDAFVICTHVGGSEYYIVVYTYYIDLYI